MFKEDVSELVDLKGNKIGPFEKGQIVNISKEIAQILIDDSKAEEAIALIREAFDKIEDRRGVRINSEIELSSKPVIFDTKMVKRIGHVCSSLSIPFIEMPSGAGHDANHIAELAPVGMIFIPSKNGRSHCPDEWSEFEHICFGTEVLAEVIVSIDEEGQI